MKKYISFLLVAALFAACTPNNEIGTPFKAGQEVTLTAHMPNEGNNGAQQLPSKQRVSGKDAGTQIDLTWDTGDQIKVTVGDKSATFTLASGAGSAQATFTGIMPADGVTYSVQYPIAEPDLSVQTYLEDGFGKGLMKMVADDGTIDDGFVLKAQHALLGLQLTGSDALGKIVLTNPADSKTYTLDCSGVTLTDEATLFYIVVPAGEWANGFTVDIYADNNSTIIKTLTKTGSATFSAIEAMVMPEQEVAADEYQGIGVFSVGEGKTVTFSPGNLQYHPANDEWRFAESQLDYIGEANSNCSSSYNGWLDLFGWGTGDNPTKSSEDLNDYQTFVDWGTNQIGNDAPNTWRTLTYDEWMYLRNNRPNANELIGAAQVKGVSGLIILPDNWKCPNGIIFKSGFHSVDGMEYYAAYQTFNADQWTKLETSGAVFLPAAGSRHGLILYRVQDVGAYWASYKFQQPVPYLFFCSNAAYMFDNNRYAGLSVRLVKDVTTNETPDIPEEPIDPSAGIGAFSVAEGKTISFSPGNLQYHPANDEWRFAESQLDYIGEANENFYSNYDGWIDLFGWSGSAASAKFGVSTSTFDSDYRGSFVDWGVNVIGTDDSKIWRTLTYDEWVYLFETRTNASSLYGVAQVNGVNGLILLPDNWTNPQGIIFKSGLHSSDVSDYAYSLYQSFTEEQWSQMELAGAVFLPASGTCGSYDNLIGDFGFYWSSTEGTDSGAYMMRFCSFSLYYSSYLGRANHLSVRLVKDL